MKVTKKITVIALYVAILIGGQLALSGISGVEIVTVLMLSFCCAFGAVSGISVATVFSLLRCLIFGFQPSVIILYLVYYNLFAVFFGTVGKKLTENLSVFNFIFIVICAVVFTACFTLLDDIITPLFYGFSSSVTKAYFYSSLYAMIPQLICTAVTTLLLYKPIVFLLLKYNVEKPNKTNY